MMETLLRKIFYRVFARHLRIEFEIENGTIYGFLVLDNHVLMTDYVLLDSAEKYE